MGFVYMTHPGIEGASQEVNDDPGAIARQQGAGWVLADRPEPGAFIPPKGDVPEADGDWVTLWHSKLKVTHQFPNNPLAIQGANEVGWVAVTEATKKVRAAVDNDPDDQTVTDKPADPDTGDQTPATPTTGAAGKEPDPGADTPAAGEKKDGE
jgi:hypothetical protein